MLVFHIPGSTFNAPAHPEDAIANVAIAINPEQIVFLIKGVRDVSGRVCGPPAAAENAGGPDRNGSMLGDELRVAAFVVFVDFARRLGASLFVRTIAVGFVLGESAPAHVNGELGAFRDFVGCLRIMLD